MTLARRLAVAMFTAVVATPSLPASAAAPNYAAINTSVVDKHALPRYHALSNATENLVSSIDHLCRQVSHASLSTAREAFHLAFDGWQGVEHLRQGPAAEVEAHIRVKFWPDRRNLVGRHLRRTISGNDGSILEPATFATTSIAVQGFPALEQLLFGKEATERLKSPDGPITRCKIARAISVNLRSIAQDLHAGWRNNPDGNRPHKRVTSDLFNDLVTGLVAIADLKLGSPMGSNGRTRPRQAESHLSGRSLRNVTKNLEALKDLYISLASAPSSPLAGTAGDQTIRNRFNAAIAESKSLGPSITAILETTDGPRRLTALKTAIKEMTRTVALQVSEALSLVLGFNALDGD